MKTFLYLQVVFLLNFTLAEKKPSGCYNFYLGTPGTAPAKNPDPKKPHVPRNLFVSRAGSGEEIVDQTSATITQHEDYLESERKGTLKFSQSVSEIQDDLSSRKLRKRFQTPNKINFLASGDGACGPYDSEKQLGVCLWTGDAKSKDPTKSGWISVDQRGNCGKTVFVQRANNPDTLIFAKVVDGCSFNIADHHTGCAQIFLTKKAFEAMKPTPEELQQGAITNLVWDFNTKANMVV
ncbi:secreted protein [Melampsora americana]|nr:secreted protein [Melampsora americana]